MYGIGGKEWRSLTSPSLFFASENNTYNDVGRIK